MKALNRDLLNSNIEQIAQYDLSNNNIFGSAYLVRQEGEIVCKRCFGTTDPETGTPVTGDTVFRLASMTKPITAAAALILIDRGLLSLSDPVKKYLPQFENIHIITEDGVDRGEAKTDVTILHLLTHTSGIGSTKLPDLTEEEKKSLQKSVDYYARAGLDFEPFTRQLYSAYAAFDVAAAIIEQVSGADYADFLQRELFLPCRMNDTAFTPSEDQQKRMIAMHYKSPDGKNCVRTMPDGCVFEDFPCSHKLAGAGLASTLDDYSNFAEMLLNRGRFGETQIISPETFKLLAVPYVPVELMQDSQNWGLGGRVIRTEDYHDLPVGTYGWSGAYGTHFWVDPANKITAVFMKNSGFDGGSGNQSACRFEKAVHEALGG